MYEAIVIVIGLIVIALLTYLVAKSRNHNSKEEIAAIHMLQNQINLLAGSIDQRLENNSKQITEQFVNSQSANIKLIQDINKQNIELVRRLTEQLSNINNTNREIVNFAEKLHEIQNIFKNPKQRGIVGEFLLQTVLQNVLPESIYKMQYKFKDGSIVDAVIFLDDRMVPIDAKFSVTNYTRLFDNDGSQINIDTQKRFVDDIKRRIDETSKYIKSEENTVNVALMFIPSDAIYLEMISLSHNKSINIDLVNYAYSKSVMMVSPTSLFAYLQTILLALNTLKISKDIDQVISYLNDSTKYLKEFEESMNKVGKNLNTLLNSFNEAAIKATRLSTRIAKIANNRQNLISIDKVSKDEQDERVMMLESNG